jgi:arylsulfatase A-like enzyme
VAATAGAKPERPWIVLASARVDVPGPPAPRRVLVWISQDTVRADHVGAYGYKRKTTPAFDALARDWVVFDEAASPASWTLPALVSQFTSRYPTFHGAVGASVQRDDSQPTLFEILAASGFTVLGVTGNHFVSADFRTAGGFDALGYTDGHAEEVDRLARDALGEWGGGDLALFVHYMDPHAPYDPPPRYGRLFDPDYRGKVTGRNFDGLAKSAFAPADVDHVRALYDGELAYEDVEIGELLGVLRAQGLLEDAVIVYSADHGEEFLEHGGWEHSHTLYEEMLHVPFALRVPGVAGRRVQPVVSTIDLAPTVLDALGIASPPSFQGRSLMPAARGGRLSDVPVFAETERTLDGNHRVAVRSATDKCIVVARPGREVPPQILSEECYDLARDPGERGPLPASAECTCLRDQAVAYLSRARQEAKAQKPAELPPEVLERLRALGYLQ